jgi:glycosyltransferase involved in cell wall biosynthesis
MTLVNLPAVRRRAAETLSHTALSVSRTIVRDHPDVAFVFNAANAPFLPALQAARIPVAVHVDGLEWKRGKWGPKASAYYRWAEARSARWGDAVIADAQGIADHMSDAHGVTSHVIAYGAPIVAPDDHRLAEIGAVSRGYHLVVARLEPENHVHMIVSGYARSGCARPLVIVGDAPYADSYRALVHAAAEGDRRIQFLGSVWDPDLLDTLYAHSLTYLHGHSVGGTNPSLLRALGAGAPVSAYDVSFNREVAADAGAYFSDEATISALCEDAERDPEAAIARGRAGQADVAERYRWAEVTDGYEALAVELLNRRRAR